MKPRYRVLAPPVREPATLEGGVERYARWLRAHGGPRFIWSSAGPASPEFGLKARLGGEAVRLGDGVSAAWIEATGRSALRWRRHLQTEAVALRRAKTVVAISPMTRDDLWKHHRIESQVVLNPVLAKPCGAAAKVQARAQGPLIFVGHGFARKGLKAFIEMLEHLPGVRAIVVGRDPHQGRWIRRARRRGVLDRLQFVGALEAGPLIADARVLVHPARYEPYGNVVAEAVAAGIPAVVSTRVGARCLLRPECIWAAEEGPEGLARRVAQQLADPSPPRRQPPTTAEHLAALHDALGC